jgi:hypothetical protein
VWNFFLFAVCKTTKFTHCWIKIRTDCNTFSWLVIVQVKIRTTMEKAFWDGIMESMKQDDPDYERVIQLMREVRDEICEIAPQSWKQQITDAIDIDVLSQVVSLLLLQPAINSTVITIIYQH